MLLLRISYEIRTNFGRRLNNLHEYASFLCRTKGRTYPQSRVCVCVCVCVWLFMWVWGDGVCVFGLVQILRTSCEFVETSYELRTKFMATTFIVPMFEAFCRRILLEFRGKVARISYKFRVNLVRLSYHFCTRLAERAHLHHLYMHRSPHTHTRSPGTHTHTDTETHRDTHTQTHVYQTWKQTTPNSTRNKTPPAHTPSNVQG